MQLWRETGTSQNQQMVLTQCNNSNHFSWVSELVPEVNVFLCKEAKSANSESGGNRYFRFSNDKGCGQSSGKVITIFFISFDTLGQFTVLCSLIAFQSVISRKCPEHSSVFQTKASEFASHV